MLRPVDDLVHRFRGSVHAWPDRIALSGGDESFTYAALDRWSDALAQRLRTQGVRPGERVILRMEPGVDAAAAVLAVLKCGAAYVPVDVRHPVSRREFIVRDCEARALVGSWGEAELPSQVEVVVGRPDVVAARTAHAEAPRPPKGPGPEDTAYVIYTSGTTGVPKGVPVKHRHVQALLDGAAQVFRFTEQDRWLLFHSIAFDFSVWEMWGAWGNGAELVVPPQWAARSPERILELIRSRGISVLNQTPTAFATLAEAAARVDADLPDLRYVVFGGEKLSPPSLRAWAKRYGLERPRLVNGYGITETTVFTTFHEVTEEDLAGDVSVIGEPLPGFVARVMTEDGREAEPGEIGELWLAGPQVAEGYLNRPELTEQKFPLVSDGPAGTPVRHYRSGDLVSRSPNGGLVYDGRADLQVKLRGYRMELSDIETAVRRHESVLDAVVTVQEFKPGDLRLVCAYTVREDAPAAPAPVLRRHIKEWLPAYMHPARYLALGEMPRTVNGKVDRAAIARICKEEIARAWAS
ncbi:amino acid adenylation domain-containing protein [Streptomyces sp. 130]|uniref:amino acid adenylation domain-containing protein n=1 Tax=Streptomyces sp. 130 TaxID=2591006 RepID=UPI00117E1771|nr:amino acid adenylation domain-containing protein [Streptomyces sp. 130]TRV71531.1 amino acid adenylation domain-containing protein [Streptomyces sp. 130]